jgi:hypothetical protein
MRGCFCKIAADLDLDALGRGSGRYLSFGAYPTAAGHAFAPGIWRDGMRLHPLDLSGMVEEHRPCLDAGPAAHPARGQTLPDEAMRDAAYSWCKAPRLERRADGNRRAGPAGHRRPSAGARSGRRGRAGAGGRAALWSSPACQKDDGGSGAVHRPDRPFMATPPCRRGHRRRPGRGRARRAGPLAARRGGRIAAYQIVAPTTWNFSPRDGAGQPGPLEAALVGAPVGPGETTPIAVQHIVRSFDPCMVCTVH